MALCVSSQSVILTLIFNNYNDYLNISISDYTVQAEKLAFNYLCLVFEKDVMKK